MLTVLGAITLVIGLVAGVAARQLLDTSRFVDHADRARQDPAVSRHIAVAVSDRLIEEQPDLVAVRPLLEGALQAAVQSPAFRPIFRTAVAPLHQALIGDAPSAVVLRIADAGAVLLAVARSVLPHQTEGLPSGIEVQLARFGAGGAGEHTLAGLRAVRLLSWLSPLLSLLCFAAVVVWAPGRRREALGAVGAVVGLTGLVLAVSTVVGTFLSGRLVPDTLAGSLAEAAWHGLDGPLRNTALVAAPAGYLLAASSRISPETLVGHLSGLRYRREPASGSGGWRAWLATTTWSDLPVRMRLVLAGSGTALGVLLVLEPVAMVALVAIAIGGVLALNCTLALLRTADDVVTSRRAARRIRLADVREASGGHADIGPPEEVRPTGRIAGVTLALALLAGLVVWNSTGNSASGSLRAAAATACNGSPRLCSRRYNQVAFPATHNSMAAADEPGWFLAEQPHGLIEQLDAGIRGFLIDTWYGQPTSQAGMITNTDESRASALAQAEAEWGPAVVESALRLRRAAGLVPRGEVSPYLCHALCVLGSTSWEPLMAEVHEWLEAHPREVLTFILQDEVTPATTAQVFAKAGLLANVYTPGTDGSWPTLEQMIDSGHRIVVMAENVGGGSRYPWLLPAFEEVQDTPFDARRVGDFSCRLNRGPASAPLFLVNHWLNRPLRVSAAREANSDAVLGARLTRCEQERGRLPNFVAVDNYDQGDLLGQVRRLNGL